MGSAQRRREIPAFAGMTVEMDQVFLGLLPSNGSQIARHRQQSSGQEVPAIQLNTYAARR